jgi:hypothetical protein
MESSESFERCKFKLLTTFRDAGLNFYQNLENRADRYIARKDTLLLRAVIRIWRARMRGVKLQRFKEITTLQVAWHKWIYRLSKEGAQKGMVFSGYAFTAE